MFSRSSVQRLPGHQDADTGVYLWFAAFSHSEHSRRRYRGVPMVSVLELPGGIRRIRIHPREDNPQATVSLRHLPLIITGILTDH